jgi:hypothetical protein
MNREHGLKLIDHIFIYSGDRDTTNSTSTTNLLIEVDHPTDRIDVYQILKINIPLVYDNITSATNSITIGGTLSTIRSGSYDSGSLLTELNDNVPANFVWTFENNRRYRITSTLAAIFTLLPGELTQVLGFDPTATYTGSTFYEAPFYPNLQYQKDFFTVRSKALAGRVSHGFNLTSRQSNILTVIPNITNYGSMLVWEPEYPLFLETFPHKKNKIDIQIYDSANNILDIDQRDFSLLLGRYSKYLN